MSQRWTKGITTRLIPLALALVALPLLSSCGGGGGEDVDEVVDKIAEAIEQPGMVYHAQGTDGSEVWIDAENEVFRRKEPAVEGGLTVVGEGWIQTAYDPASNEVVEDTFEPGETPRINHPMIYWTDALAALAFGRDLELIGRTTSDGREVIAIQATSPVVSEDTGEIVGNLIGRIEVDPVTYLTYSFQSRQQNSDGTTNTPAIQGVDPNARVIYTVSEMIPRDSLPDDFFSRAVVEDLVLSLADNLRAIESIGLDPLWVGELFQSPGGVIALPENNAILVGTTTQEASLHYSLLVPVSDTDVSDVPDSVIISLAGDPSLLSPPTFEQIGGTLPEQEDPLTWEGGEGTLYTSLLTPTDLCDPSSPNCVETPVALYRRLVFMVGDVAVQIEALARLSPGTPVDINGFNQVEGMVELAEALTLADIDALEAEADQAGSS